MKYYRVVGHITKGRSSSMIDDIQPVDQLVQAANKNDAAWYAAEGWEWLAPPTVRPALLSDIERQALADWIAQRPTSNPLALAQARGEL